MNTTASTTVAGRPRVLIVGTFPPVTGPGGPAVAAVRRAWNAGDEVISASLRPSGADVVALVAGVAAGRRLERLRVEVGRPRRLVLELDDDVLRPAMAGVGPSWFRQGAAWGGGVLSAGGLIRVLDRFEHVTVLVSSPLHLPPALLDRLWRHVGAVVVPPGAEAAVAASRIPPALVAVDDDEAGAVLPAAVTRLGPPEILPNERATWLIEAGARRLLGRRYGPVRGRAVWLVRNTQRILRGVRRRMSR